MQVSRGRIRSGFVIDISDAKKRLRSREIRQPKRPCILDTLDLTEEFQRFLDDGVMNSRAEIARRYGTSRARVTQVLALWRLHPAILDAVRRAAEEDPTTAVLVDRYLGWSLAYLVRSTAVASCGAGCGLRLLDRSLGGAVGTLTRPVSPHQAN
jgi:hypothetical protein